MQVLVTLIGVHKPVLWLDLGKLLFYTKLSILFGKWIRLFIQQEFWGTYHMADVHLCHWLMAEPQGSACARLSIMLALSKRLVSGTTEDQ